jgi:hypothetical protein
MNEKLDIKENKEKSGIKEDENKEKDKENKKQEKQEKKEIQEKQEKQDNQEEEQLYYYKLCKNKRYIINEIKKIDGEYLLKIDPYKSGVIAYTKNYGYIFERTIHFLYIFKERINLSDEEKKDLENEEPLTDRKGHYYTYSDKDLKLAIGDHPPVTERIEIIKIIIDKFKKHLDKKKENK